MEDLQKLEDLLKVSGCIKTELVPGSDFSLDKKTYEWKLIEFT